MKIFYHSVQAPVQQCYTDSMQMASQNSDKIWAATASNLFFIPNANNNAAYWKSLQFQGSRFHLYR